MGGYGFSIAESDNYILTLSVNWSGKEDKYYFEIENKKTKESQSFSDWSDSSMMDTAMKEFEESRSLFYIKDQKIRDKATFERDFRLLENRCNKTDKYNIKLRGVLDKINELLGNRFPIGLMYVKEDPEAKS